MLFETVEEYVKLERVEIAGLKGKALSSTVYDIYEEFTKIYKELTEVEYDILDPTNLEFSEDLENFLSKVEKFDRRLASVLDQALVECHNTEATYKLIWIIGSLANRPIVMAQLWHNYERLLRRIHKHFHNIKMIINQNSNLPEATRTTIVDQYFPPVAGALCFLMKLRNRVEYPMHIANLLDHPLIANQIMQQTRDMYDELQGLLDTIEHEIFKEWADSVPGVCQKHLSKSLLQVTDDKLLQLNFDPELTAMFREIRYMIIIKKTDLPQEALELYDRTQSLFESTSNLSQVVQWYNQIRSDCSSVEFDLIRKEIEMIDEVIELGQKNYNWDTPEVKTYVEELLHLTRRLYTRVFSAQENVKNLLKSIYAWAMIPVMRRRGNRADALLETTEYEDRFEKRYTEVRQAALTLETVLKKNYEYFFDLHPEDTYEREQFDLDGVSEVVPENVADDGQGNLGFTEGNEETTVEDKVQETAEQTPLMGEETDTRWRPYLTYMDDLISKALIQAVSTSICYILDETDPEAKISPLFEIQVCLEASDIVFKPPIDMGHTEGFYTFFDGLLFDIIKMATLIPRVDPDLTEEREHYGVDVTEDDGIAFMLEETCNRVKLGLVQAQEYSAALESYSWLWLNDRQKYLDQFLRFGRELTKTERVTQTTENFIEPIKEKKPNLMDFRREIERFMTLYKQYGEIESEKVIQRWLRIDLKPFKQTLLNTVCKWANLLKTHLVDQVNNRLQELSTFINSATHMFTQPVVKDDYDVLLETIYYLKEVRDRQYEIDDAFEPIKEMIDMLKEYQVTFDESTYNSLVLLPEHWMAVKKLATQVKQIVGPLMAHQIELLKKRLNYYDYRQQALLTNFHVSELFRPECSSPYEKLDKMHEEISKYESELRQLQDQATIFEQQTPEFPQVRQARREVRLLKNLWDFVNIVSTSLDEWKKTVWQKIDVEEMDQECKKLTRELRQLDKEARTWDLYAHVQDQVRNMMSSLRAVSELQNPAIKDRHWQELMAETCVILLAIDTLKRWLLCRFHILESATYCNAQEPKCSVAIGVKFTMDKDTTLEKLLKIELHKYEEEVKNTVDKAVKEMAMEKVLKEIKTTWLNMEFEKETHERTKLTLLKISEETIEALEENQVQLQNMLGSKYIGHFLEEVTDWQKKLNLADSVIEAWFDLQRAWINLESIFIASEDIRNQLPEDTKRFEKIDKDFKELLKEMQISMNIIKSTGRPRLLERLEELMVQLNFCEKALANYLETKRLAYPRFYFISTADLLDILSNGNNPELVCKHLSKLYDSIAKLKWKMDAEKVTKVATCMVAKDGEEMALHGSCDCSGKVEVWLNHVTEVMRRSVRYHISQSVATYEEKPRELWILDYNAQPALCGVQIWWTTEVNIAFARLEEGFEYALKDYQKKQVQQLNALITILCGVLGDEERQKIMTICTIDVHARDVVAKLISTKTESATSFQWQSQLRHRWEDKSGDCYANICDASFPYSYEYLGNVPRLVITPLTDRCYITLTQSLHLTMGGAPAGPAGTGKTETTKDLGRALGQMVYVFNCSEQMDYKSCGNIYKGLAQTGAWGCFDEFNRISVEVLSVVAVQVKCVLDGLKARRKKFLFFGEELNLKDTVGMFITMNPGYAGRTELPENLKALFRPCAMVVPDFELICEIMLVAEGFQESRLLARKFVTLYTLCRELLSKQDHYDWGLRAIKSVLVVAGKLKRSDIQRSEDEVLMRALRDFNTSKIVTDDVQVFLGLVGDLFPALNVPRKRDFEFEKLAKEATIDLNLQPEDSFILKVVQLEELLNVRHSVFIVGLAGTGKSQIWKTLFHIYVNQKRKPHYNDLNPKAVTNDELFGIINPATREWKDGLFSVIMRDQANMLGDGPKWIIFDGDIDPMWIESLNTVMDDNKVLTLASNERIALTRHMRLLFEISNLRYVTSWIETREHSERANMVILFDKYVPALLEVMRSRIKKITPIPDVCHLQMLCNLLDCLLTKENLPPECPKEWSELYFAFGCVWAFGSTTFQDQLIDWRSRFNKWWHGEFKTVKFPPAGTIFDYFIDPETKRFLPWSEKVDSFKLDSDIPLQSTLVSTGETACLKFFMDLLMKKRVPILLVGATGCGKSVIVSQKLTTLPENYNVANVPFNFYTTSEMLQRMLEKNLEKKAGRNYGPTGTKLLVYFIDDMNMPEVDSYGTVQPHTLIRQHIDYGHWYDRTTMTLKDVHGTQYVSCMNPTAGSFTIDPRLQRHFAVFAVNFPHREALSTIYSQILCQHLLDPLQKFSSAVQKLAVQILETALFFHEKITGSFLPTATKFHYMFNLRDLSNIFQGMLFANGEAVAHPDHLVKLYVHEAMRVYRDKLVDFVDKRLFDQLLTDALKKSLSQGSDVETIFEEPLIFCHFAEGIGESKYMPIKGWEQITKLLNEALLGYNETEAAMNLVLFKDAMYHVCRINRILEAPRGNALLVGVGGSGKQSLSRLSSFISGLEVFQIQLKSGYSLADMRSDLAGLYLKAGLKSVPITFLMTDAQVAEEKFLVVVNDMLASGEIVDLFADDELENVINAVRSEVGPTLRKRARQFPALVNCTSINWFEDWPQDALKSVSSSFLKELDELPPIYRPSASLFMSFVHGSVNEASLRYYRSENRRNYTTPKSYLGQIELYSKLLVERTYEVRSTINRLVNGLTKLDTCAGQVESLQITLAEQEIELRRKNEVADKILSEVRTENAKAETEKAYVSEEEAKVAQIRMTVAERQKRCDEDLAKAEPAVRQAEAALNTLNKNNLTELKSFGTPPEAVSNVAQAVLVLFSPKGKIPKDRSWKACKAMMGSADSFLSNLRSYDKENIHPDVVKAIQPYINDKEFDPDFVHSKSQAAAGLCSWVKNIMVFHYINETVKPLRAALAQANLELRSAMDKLTVLRARMSELQKVLDVLSEKMNVAMVAKQKCHDEAEATALTIDLANRLVNGLASEKIRWAETVETLRKSQVTIPGDVLLVAAFISYLGYFSRRYRFELVNESWIPFFEELKTPIPRTQDLDLLSSMADDAQIAKWNNEGLPTDRMSAENASILVNASRWPLMVDPQLQGLRWIKTRYGEELKILRLTQKNYLEKIELAIANGDVVLLENVMETIDAVLDPVLGKVLIKKGRSIRIGDKEVDYDSNFRLILQTKLANPHYKPEIQAQTTLINFTVTRDGLEEQLLGSVVKAERPDLEETKAHLTTQQNTFKITLKSLEDDLLHRLSTAGPNILQDAALVVNLEKTKKTAADIEGKVVEAKITSKKIDEAREWYRPIASRASLLYFVLNDLKKINMLYQFSLKAFDVVFQKAIETATPSETLLKRVNNLMENITYHIFVYTSRGLFEADKLIFLCHMTIQILLHSKEVSQVEVDFLLRYASTGNVISPVEFLTDEGWAGIKHLSRLEEFRNLDKDIEGAAKRWRKFVESETPEMEKFPQDWKDKTALQRLCIMRCMRLDRMTYAIRCFVEEKLGARFVEARIQPFSKSFEETSSCTPVFFILSPGVDPLKRGTKNLICENVQFQDVENLGKSLGYTLDGQNFHNVSLGQGQEPVAEEAIDLSSLEGHWIILQNVHLVRSWLPSLEKRIEQVLQVAHVDFRLFISAEPSQDPQESLIPQGILESAIKITNELPTGMHANVHKALDCFTQETLDMCTKETEFKAILFALCYYHAVVAERRKFGAQGWNRSYPFNVGDLTICAAVLLNYLENSTKVPWEELRYLFGEIMYGGHIVDDWDRRLCRTYLLEYLQPELLERELYLAPGILVPPTCDYAGYHQYVDDYLAVESPILYGLHPNAEIGFLTATAETVFRIVSDMQPLHVSEASNGIVSGEEKVKGLVEELLDKLPEEFNLQELASKIEDRSPYVTVALQECERMNFLCREIRISLNELQLGLKGELTINAAMEDLQARNVHS
ncbi:hypothetical protein KM043_013908 [Ampulex compressa]|nr:hypothetical protein KM043_013908 [Ampulex compressa]